MSGPTTRVLALLELLQTHGLLSGALPPMMFTDEETLAVSLGLLAAQQLGLAEATPAIASVQAKLERVMPANLKRRVRAVSDTTRLILPRVEPSYDNRTLLTLTTAIQSEQRVSFVYRSPQDDVMPREMDPYGLVFRRGRWYVSGFCHLRADLRSFRLDRISGVKTLVHRFTRPERFDAAEHLNSSLRNMPRSHPVSVLLQTDVDTAAQIFGFHPDAVDLFQQQDNGLLLNTHTDSYHWFAWWLSHMPFPFTVQSPPELRQALREQAQRLLEAAGE